MNNKTILTDDQIESLAGINDHNSFTLRAHNDMKLARAIEQAVLQSEQVQAWKRDAERYRWLRDPCSGAEHVVMYGRGDYGKGLKSGSTLDDDIDAAMEQQP